MHPVSEENPEIALDTKQLVEIIRQLPIGYQTIFNLVAVEGYDQIEVASMLEMNINTVRSQYSRARALLIKMLHDNASEMKIYAGKV
jgi:RNA polymerase sigma-70 factor (ECF subfamily)